MWKEGLWILFNIVRKCKPGDSDGLNMQLFWKTQKMNTEFCHQEEKEDSEIKRSCILQGNKSMEIRMEMAQVHVQCQALVLLNPTFNY
jgi:hypothetical protein